MTEIRVKEVFPTSSGIMAAVSALGGYDFNPDSDLLLLSKCGQRCITPIVEMLLDGADRLSQANIDRLAALIMAEYGDGWNRIKDALTLEYNPLSASQYHEEETTDTSGETGDNSSEKQKQDVSAINVSPGTYIPDEQNVNESTSKGTSKTQAVRKLDRTHNGTSYKSSELLMSEMAMRANNRFMAQVLDDVKNYIAMMIY